MSETVSVKKKALWRPQVLVIALALTTLAITAMFLGYVDLAQMALVAIGTALGKLI